MEKNSTLDESGVEKTPAVEPAIKVKRSKSYHKNPMNGPIRQSQDQKRAKIIELAVKHVAAPDISRAVNLPLETVKDIIKRFSSVFEELKNVGDYRSIKTDLLAAGQLAALKSAVSEKKLAKASFLTTLQGFEILNKAERLEKNLSTDNVAVGFGKMRAKELLDEK